MPGATPADADSPARFRDRFPSLTDTVHLASCSQGAASTDLSAALLEFQHTMREYGAPWDRWMAEVARARQLFAELIGAHPDEVAVVPCASDGAFQIASTYGWQERPRIVTTDMEFPSIAHVWLAQRPRGAEVVHLPDRDGTLPAEDFAAALGDRVSLVSVPLASYRNGARLPVADVVGMAHDAGARVFVDAYQAAGVLPIDVRELDCDYLVAGALKYLLGIPGIAFLYVRGGLTDEVPPQLTGWFAQSDPYAFDPRTLDLAPTARRFETGTPSIPSAYGAVAGMRCLARADQAAVWQHVGELATDLHESLARAGEQLWSPAEPALRGAQVAIVDEQPTELAAYLANRRIATSPRGHVLRLSLHYYNDHSDVAKVCEAIADYRKHRA
ncbi:MAG: aminotransferase class V-fold PLP-dependent enzyme [Streptosporangiales bacterium]|nr:aminotransferase class V-fold PLP-dependent enzyme [Streptosporangiales bacterium]